MLQLNSLNRLQVLHLHGQTKINARAWRLLEMKITISTSVNYISSQIYNTLMNRAGNLDRTSPHWYQRSC